MGASAVKQKAIEPSPRTAERANARHVQKRCRSCGNYFEGELDGTYLCLQCRQDDPLHLQGALPLTDLEIVYRRPAHR